MAKLHFILLVAIALLPTTAVAQVTILDTIFTPAGYPDAPMWARIHIPDPAKGNGVGIVMTHGYTAPPTGNQFWRDSLVAHGYLVMAVEHPDMNVDPDGLYPRLVRAAKTAVQFLRRNAARFGITTGKIVAWGQSQGSMIWGQTIIWDNDHAFFGTDSTINDHVDAAVLLYGLYDMYNDMPMWVSDLLATHFSIDSSLRGTKGQCITNVWNISTPVLLLHATGDPIAYIAHSRRLRDSLNFYGRTVKCIEFNSSSHTFDAVSDYQFSALGLAAKDSTLEFLNNVLAVSETGPKIGVRTDTLDFGNVFLQSSDTLTLTIRNLGYPDTLLVTDIHSDNGDFTPDISSFALPGASGRIIKVRLHPSSAGSTTAILSISSNDTAHPTTDVALRVNVFPLAPILVSPGSGATNQSITPTLTWNSIGASSYRLQVGNSSFTTVVYEDSTITDTSRQVGPLANSTSYYWRVSGKVNGLNSQYSQSRSFSTIVAAPSPPVLLYPANDAIDQLAPLSLGWSHSGSADTYHLQISKDPLFVSTVVDDSLLADTSREIGALEADVKYYWRVQAKNIGGIGAWSSVWNYLTASEVTGQYSVHNGWNIVSVPMTVSDGRKSTLFPSAISAAFAYQGGYVQKETLTIGVGFWLKFAGAESIVMTGLLKTPDSVAVQTGWNLIGSISSPVKVTTIASDPPNLVTSQFFGYSSVYSVADTIRPGKGYWVKVSQGGVLVLSSSPSISASAKDRIRIVSTSDLPPAPPVEVAAAIEIPQQYSLEQAYPNPFNPSTTIKYQLPSPSRVSLKIYNVLGQIVSTLVDETQVEGYKSVIWCAGSISSGVYIYRLEATSISDRTKIFTRARKLMLVK